MTVSNKLSDYYYSATSAPFFSAIAFNKYAKFESGALKLPSSFAISTSLGGIDASS